MTCAIKRHLLLISDTVSVPVTEGLLPLLPPQTLWKLKEVINNSGPGSGFYPRTAYTAYNRT